MESAALFLFFGPEDGPGNAMVRIFWLTRTLADLPGGDEWLSDRERAFAASLRVAKRHNDWLLGRWTAKLAVGAYLGEASEVEIHAGADGAPEAVRRGERLPVSISLSHSSGACLCVVAPPAISVGCDIERIETRDENFAADYFTGEEQALLRRAPADDHPLIATLIWSAKESALKVLRQGLRRDTRSVVVDLDPAPAGRGWDRFSVRCAESARTLPGWWKRHGEFILAIAADVVIDEPQ